MPSRRLLALAAAAMVAAAGCGEDPNEAAVRSAATAFFKGARTPSPELCDVLSAEFLRLRTGAQDAAKALARCRQSALRARGKTNDRIPASVEITSVSIDGARATARAEAAGQRPAIVRLVREGGAWKVDGEGPAPGP